MFNLIEYYEENDIVKYHIVDMADSREEINEKKAKVAKTLNEIGIETLEVIASKNINSMKEILKQEHIKIFRVIEQ